MIRYLIGRVGQAVLVLMVTFTAAFLLLQALPGDAIMIKFMSPDMGLSADQIAEIRAAYGADLPIWDRLFGTYRDADSFAPACGFPRNNERKLGRMLMFKDVYND